VLLVAIFDPNASRPPLNEDEIRQKQEFYLTKFNIASNVPQKIERLKIALALKELDYLVQVMQSAYQKVEIEFINLKQKLYLKKKA